MKPLFNHNLSPRLVRRLGDLYPDASHVSLVGLDRATDIAVWEYAGANGYTIVTKDPDYSDLSVLRGFPPKVIWLRLGNCTTDDIDRALRRSHEAIVDFSDDPTAGVLEVF
jgi:predicted nuclease of predicted toxin-antitoxin system